MDLLLLALVGRVLARGEMEISSCFDGALAELGADLLMRTEARSTTARATESHASTYASSRSQKLLEMCSFATWMPVRL